MRTKIHLVALFSVMTFLLNTENAKAGNKMPGPDSTCCTPDNLTLVHINYPVFCVRWKVRSDSTCINPQGFEIQWKLLSAAVWQSQIVTYTSGIYIDYCDSVDTCGAYQWRVRTKCNDSLHSSWVYGKKFTMSCDSGDARVQHLSISPNPATASVTITARNIKPGSLKISVVDIAGRNVAEKIVYTRGDKQLLEKLSVGSWPKGIYFVNILSNGTVISRGRFLKE